MIYFENKEMIENFIKKNHIEIKDPVIKKLLKKISRNEKLMNIFIKIGIFMFIAWQVLMFFTLKHFKFITCILGGAVFAFPAFFIGWIFSLLKNSQIEKVENYIYENFVKDDIKVFSSTSLLKDYSYEVINDKIFDDIKSSDAKVYLSFIAKELNADGYAIAHKNKYTTTQGSVSTKWNRVEGEISSSTHTEYEVIFLKNIKRLDNNITDNNTNDLNYWFELKQKGAITQEEYEQKKKEIIDSA